MGLDRSHEGNSGTRGAEVRRERPGCFQLAQHAQVVAPKGSGAGNGQAQVVPRLLFRGLFLSQYRP